MIDWKTIEIPKIMRTLERDKRGYPIPVIVLRDAHGKPLFTRNDANVMLNCARKKLCSICGKRLTAAWFVSGSRSFLSPYGVFLDPPTHLECAEYALQVCPFLAAPNVSKTMTSKLKPEQLEGRVLVEKHSDYVGPVQPEIFGLGLAQVFTWRLNAEKMLRFKVTDWGHIEFWRNGEMQDSPTAAKVKELLDVVPLVER